MERRSHGLKERDVLLDAVFIDCELFLLQVGDVLVATVAGDDGDGDEVRLDLDGFHVLLSGGRALAFLWLRLCALCLVCGHAFGLLSLLLRLSRLLLRPAPGLPARAA